MYEDDYLEVRGESHYQSALERLAGGRTEDGVEAECEAHLVPEPSNPHDALAVQVVIGGCLVGYLGREDARLYRQCYGVQERRCPALIVGGWDRGPDDRGYFGVKLDLMLAAQTSRGVGLGEALKRLILGTVLAGALLLMFIIGLVWLWPVRRATPAPAPTAAPVLVDPVPTEPADAWTATPVLSPTPTASATPQPRPIVQTAANLRSGPGTQYSIIGSAAVGQELVVDGRNTSGDWLRLTSGAWIMASLVAPVPAVQVVDTPTATP